MMHIILRDGLHDKDYHRPHTLGIEELRTRVLEYTPARVSVITGIPEAAIERLTQEYAAEIAQFIRLNYGLNATPAAPWLFETSSVCSTCAWRHPAAAHC
jgi:anaerobic selenocysteine-containing dehydrogenase